MKSCQFSRLIGLPSFESVFAATFLVGISFVICDDCFRPSNTFNFFLVALLFWHHMTPPASFGEVYDTVIGVSSAPASKVSRSRTGGVKASK
jgi:hypothetical protein